VFLLALFKTNDLNWDIIFFMALMVFLERAKENIRGRMDNTHKNTSNPYRY